MLIMHSNGPPFGGTSPQSDTTWLGISFPRIWALLSKIRITPNTHPAKPKCAKKSTRRIVSSSWCIFTQLHADSSAPWLTDRHLHQTRAVCHAREFSERNPNTIPTSAHFTRLDSCISIIYYNDDDDDDECWMDSLSVSRERSSLGLGKRKSE